MANPIEAFEVRCSNCHHECGPFAGRETVELRDGTECLRQAWLCDRCGTVIFEEADVHTAKPSFLIQFGDNAIGTGLVNTVIGVAALTLGVLYEAIRGSQGEPLRCTHCNSTLLHTPPLLDEPIHCPACGQRALTVQRVMIANAERSTSKSANSMKVVLDSNIYDLLVDDADGLARTNELVEAGELVIVCPATVKHELEKSPFGGVPSEVLVLHEPDSVLVWDHSRWDEARWGDGTAYNRHKGESNKVADAVIAESAITDADLFVTEDKRSKKRAKNVGYECFAVGYEEFRAKVLKLPPR